MSEEKTVEIIEVDTQSLENDIHQDNVKPGDFEIVQEIILTHTDETI